MSNPQENIDPFLGPKLKIKRAESHIKEIHSAYKAYRESNPHEGFTEINPDTQQLVYKLRVLKPIPQDFPTIVGDAIQNLRASLDHAACCLAIQRDPTVNINDVSFPIARNAQKFEAAAKERIKKLTPEAIAYIKALKPYKGGNDAFWRLHRLSVRDRHRLLLTTWIGRGRIAFKPILPTLPGEEKPMDVETPYIWITPEDPFEPLEDGAILFAMPASEANKTIHDEIQAEIDVAFGDGEVVKAEPIGPALLQLRDFVESVISAIGNRFFK